MFKHDDSSLSFSLSQFVPLGKCKDGKIEEESLESLEEIIFVAPNLLLRVESATSLIKVFFISCCEFKVTIVTCVTASATLEVISICNFNYKFAKVSIEYVL